ncbi:hypothetical protein Pan97_07940 [Bremerella volcania]|uniref:Uncharacterized protein n=1 Tax=Bremerella volcania TaxID=2527984 RepID=A0A518C3N2_9BACT|nr:DUF4410 domain-containing protein [Bremerella volcania]QDU73794.1 hypothetical protein Pan97_07940 [Bremerella volcania]
MDLDNPFRTPTEDSSGNAVSSNSIRIEPFQVRASGFHCRVLTEAQVSEMLAKELATFCGEQGFEIINGKAQYTIKGEIVKIDQGNQLLRYLLPYLAGEAMVEIHGEVVQGTHSSKTFHIKKTFSMGVFGGSSKGMIKDGLRLAAMKIAADAGLVGHQTSGLKRGGSGGAALDPMNTWLYLGLVALAALIAALIVGNVANGWALAAPERHDGIAMEDRGGWVLLQGVLAFISILFGGLAAAPDSVLKSSGMIWLRANAGVKSIIAQRILLGILCAVPILLAHLSKLLM